MVAQSLTHCRKFFFLASQRIPLRKEIEEYNCWLRVIPSAAIFHVNVVNLYPLDTAITFIRFADDCMEARLVRYSNVDCGKLPNLQKSINKKTFLFSQNTLMYFMKNPIKPFSDPTVSFRSICPSTLSLLYSLINLLCTASYYQGPSFVESKE